MPKNKCPGPDGTQGELLIVLPNSILEVIFHWFQIIYDTGWVPPEFTTSYTILLPKDNDTHKPNRHRPIGLTNTIYKLYTYLLTEGLMVYAEHHGLISHAQEGF